MGEIVFFTIHCAVNVSTVAISWVKLCFFYYKLRSKRDNDFDETSNIVGFVE